MQVRKRLMKALSLVCAAITCSSVCVAATGCGVNLDDLRESEFSEVVDTTKTQLYVGNYNGGLGFQWLVEAKELFEAEHPNVQIMIENGKDQYAQNALLNNIKTNKEDMYCLDSLDYYMFANAGHLLEVTDVVTKGGENSIENRMNESLKNFYKNDKGQYYGLPFYESFFSMNYDVDLFDEYLLYLNEDGTDFVTSLDEPRYPGLNGEAYSWDAGLPRTYSQFFKLLDRMVAMGITPFTWSGAKKDQYVQEFLASVMADYQGAGEESGFGTNYSLNGTTKVLKNYDFTEPATGTFSLPAEYYETKDLTVETTTDVSPMQAGRYYAIKFAKDMMSGGYKYVNQRTVNSPSESHMLAQSTFLRSRYEGKPIAMLIEGGWWYNEAKVTIDSMASEYGSEWSYENRNFGIMPIPKADDGSSAEGRTVASSRGVSAVVISKYTKKAELAKEFFEFIHSEEVMRIFTKCTNVLRPYEYTMTEDDLKDANTYLKNVLAYTEDITVEYTLPRSYDLADDIANLGIGNLFTTRVGTMEKSNPSGYFFEYPSATAKDYFKGIKTYWTAKPPQFN